MIHTNPPPKIVTSGTLSRPPIPTIPTNPLQYTLSSTNMHTTQNSVSSSVHFTQVVTSNTTIQHNNVPVSPRSSIRTNPFFIPVSQIPTSTNNLQTNTLHSNYHITHPYTQSLTTVSNATYINSSASISEPINPVDGFYPKYTPEAYFQHIEALAIFIRSTTHNSS